MGGRVTRADSTAAATVVVSTTTVAATYWAFTLGIAALSLASLRLVERGMTGMMQELALLLFMGANIAIGSIALGTVRLLLRGKLLS
jgi:tellurite resistance protein